jgi:hypothetical protein
MIAKFSGFCRECHKPINKGEAIERSILGWTHVGCGAGSAAFNEKWIGHKNDFARREAAQERAAYERDAEREMERPYGQGTWLVEHAGDELNDRLSER